MTKISKPLAASVLLLAWAFVAPARAGLISIFDPVALVEGVTAIEDVTGVLDADSYLLEHPADGPLPLLGDAFAASQSASAASSLAGAGSLVAETSVFGADAETALARASADFGGSFIAPAGQLSLHLSLDHQALVEGLTATSETDLRLAVMDSMGNTLAEVLALLTGADATRSDFDRTFVLPAGEVGSVAGFVSSVSDAAADASASSLTVVDFELRAVPEPGTWTLLGLGLAAMVPALRRPSRRRARPTG